MTAKHKLSDEERERRRAQDRERLKAAAEQLLTSEGRASRDGSPALNRDPARPDRKAKRAEALSAPYGNTIGGRFAGRR
jgi:hypothetical protein